MDEKEKILAQTIEMLNREFKLVSPLIDEYVRHTDSPTDADTKFFRLRFMQKICQDLIDILKKNGKLNEDSINGTELALVVFDRVKHASENVL